jgi:hypothetical protein
MAVRGRLRISQVPLRLSQVPLRVPGPLAQPT